MQATEGAELQAYGRREVHLEDLGDDARAGCSRRRRVQGARTAASLILGGGGGGGGLSRVRMDESEQDGGVEGDTYGPFFRWRWQPSQYC